VTATTFTNRDDDVYTTNLARRVECGNDGCCLRYPDNAMLQLKVFDTNSNSSLNVS
jgi:hypothetical protein